ncbi:hypothetical protein DYB32_002763 [Aphanomyces invadans]|uniref:EF-hand domain-containing protein n=1 Tax=Aphanomyces invadans TaxID=157072 RepID=A0A3R7AC80_9STRA|nr:hypothetical protein DYB32_002763 [Aphanomyces invadans]
MRSCFGDQDVDMILDRFNLFDHAETGTIDHDELFVFFHGLSDALALGNVQPLVAQLKSVDKITLPAILHVLLGVMKPEGPPNPTVFESVPSSTSDAVDATETKETLLALSQDCPPDNWGLDDIVPAPVDPTAKTAHAVIKRVTITNNTNVKKPKKPRAGAMPRVGMVHNGMNEHSVKKFWEATIRDHGLTETSGLFQKFVTYIYNMDAGATSANCRGEKRMLTETHTRLKSEESAMALLQLRVRSRLSEGFIVVEGKKFVADALAADKATKEKQAASVKQKSPSWTFKKTSLDKGSTVVRSTPNLPLYSSSHHLPLYQKAAYQLPPAWHDHAAAQHVNFRFHLAVH